MAPSRLTEKAACGNMMKYVERADHASNVWVLVIIEKGRKSGSLKSGGRLYYNIL
jgi:hypothetical protein